jgi:type I restriction enzyme M protein
MLDSVTKRRIDSARDILVGKIPDPKSQVEQITIALIYKFMDDMDTQAETLGGKRKFFTGKFADYAWSKLLRSGLGGHEMLARYAEAISKMPENPGIPPLFRDIFKNAFLPYRDPETLRLFLRQIDEFEYDHSERLGDAFEYLLSVLGSQGDAGQFRTPRHIIDFIVSIVDPKKDEVVLDPACGTAGFLISAYKHILQSNTDAKGHSTLSPDERARLARNFKGYDISPDMVRLALANMYLHGFSNPQIWEYDTLTQQDRWNETADVILANPPFMSPKGGIKPHNRFGVQSKRSEVLFVDYMAEHLTKNGRAGIIVPEGIIFQSQTAYKQLRKMLVEEYLVAVVSLPAGVFNPYSGVKTSILILDKSLAKQSDAIAFFKIENDGFNLGAQRRPITKDDLHQARAEIAEYLHRLQSREVLDDFQPSLGLVIPKQKIAENEDFELGVERYREGAVRETKFPRVNLGEVLELEFGTRITKRDNEGTLYPVYGGGGESFRTDTFTHENDVVVSRFAMSAECVRVVSSKFYLLDSGFTYSISEPFAGRATKEYITRMLLSIQSDIYNCGRGNAQKNIDIQAFKSIEIPLPPPQVQTEIVAEIDGYQKVIDGASAVINNYRPQINIQPEWPIVNLGELATPEYGYTASAAEEGNTRFVRITDICPDGTLNKSGAKYIELTEEAKPLLLADGDILVARTGATYGKTMLFSENYPAVFASYLIRLRFSAEQVLPAYYWAFAQSLNYWTQAKSLMTGGGQPQFNGNALKQIRIPLPPVQDQLTIIADIEAEKKLVNANRHLIARMEKKIQSALARVWDATPVAARLTKGGT